jgi:hypothetical protein
MILKPVLMMDEVADFLMMTLAGCGAAFELPVIVAVLGALGIVSTKALWKFNKYALVLATGAGRRAHPQHRSLHPDAAGRAPLPALRDLDPGGVGDRARP